MNNNEIVQILHDNAMVEVQFRTKRGHIRTMQCSRKPGSVPPIPEEKIHILNGAEHVAVFDYLVNEWRAFRFDSIIEMNVLAEV